MTEQEENLAAMAREAELRQARIAAQVIEGILAQLPDVKLSGTAVVKRNGQIIREEPSE